MPELVDLEVREVSLVDWPATGRRFRVLKRQECGAMDSGGPRGPGPSLREAARVLLRHVRACRAGEDPVAPGEAPEPSTDEAPPEEVSKALRRLDALEAQVGEVTARLRRLEEPRPVRQSQVTEPGGKPSLWKGVL
ncbi:MAG TPA: hypothetical protein VGN26_22250 [Armatimonadota bacterium]|jgi:hypothetical protein